MIVETSNKKYKNKYSELSDAAIKIQTIWRGYNIRRLMTSLWYKPLTGNKYPDKMKREIILFVVRLIKIQALWRGYKTRFIFSPIFVESRRIFQMFINKLKYNISFYRNSNVQWIEDIVRDEVVYSVYHNFVIEQKQYPHNFFKKWFLSKKNLSWYNKIKEYTRNV